MPSPTNVPASLPERLADAEGELPEEIVKAIRHLTSVCMVAPGFNDATIANRNIRNGVEALTATILARLTAAESAREAAVARAEKLEKALEPFAEAADNLELLAKQDGSPPAVYKAVFWHSALVAARAALAPPATAEET